MEAPSSAVQVRDGAAALCLQSFETGVDNEGFQFGLAPVKNSAQRSPRRTAERRDNEQRGHVKGAPSDAAVKSAAPLTHSDAILPASWFHCQVELQQPHSGLQTDPTRPLRREIKGQKQDSHCERKPKRTLLQEKCATQS